MTSTVARSVEAIAEALRAFFIADQIASKDGFLQSRNPRIVVLSIAGLALAVMITRTLSVLILIGGVTVILAWRSSVPIRQLLARSSVVPLTSAFIVVPQMVLMPGDVLVEVLGISITDAGVGYVLLFTLRVGLGVTLLSLLVMTTPFSAIVAALRDLWIPVTLVWITSITYRYLFLFFDELRRLILARNSRTTGNSGVRGGWRDARRLAGTFLLRTLDRGERVGNAMRARGGGNPPSPYRRSRSTDASDYWLMVVALVAVAGSGVVRWVL